MHPKEITVCEDETFHPETCLVAIEPVSDFILVEKYAESRSATEWTSTLQQATAGLAVKIVQSTSDEGKGIVKHVQDELGAHHSPDLFNRLLLAFQISFLPCAGDAAIGHNLWLFGFLPDDLQILIVRVVAAVGGRAMRFQDAPPIPSLKGLSSACNEFAELARSICLIHAYILPLLTIKVNN